VHSCGFAWCSTDCIVSKSRLGLSPQRDACFAISSYLSSMEWMQMESNYLRNVEYIDFSYFPVLPEDYEGTSDRPSCEKPPWTAHYTTQVCPQMTLVNPCSLGGAITPGHGKSFSWARPLMQHLQKLCAGCPDQLQPAPSSPGPDCQRGAGGCAPLGSSPAALMACKY
jgi:hypothetical protein